MKKEKGLELCEGCKPLEFCLFERSKEEILSVTPNAGAANPQEAVSELRQKAVAWGCREAIEETGRIITQEEKAFREKAEKENLG